MKNDRQPLWKRVLAVALALVLLSLTALSAAAASSKAGSSAAPDTYTFGSQERIRTWTLFDPSDKYNEQYPYCVAVNTKQNLVIVYSKNFAGTTAGAAIPASLPSAAPAARRRPRRRRVPSIPRPSTGGRFSTATSTDSTQPALRVRTCSTRCRTKRKMPVP